VITCSLIVYGKKNISVQVITCDCAMSERGAK